MKKYLINLMGYLGVGFIGGSISHGFFSETRSFVMAGLGISIFLIAEFLKEGEKDYLNTIVFGLFYSLCIGMVSGGFQHFLDSPQRSMYIIPIGFVLGSIIYAYKDNKNSLTFASIGKTLAIGVLLFGLGYGTWKYLPASLYSSVASGHNESGGHDEAGTTAGGHDETGGHDEEVTNTGSKIDITKRPSWMQGRTEQAITEHCQMMPSMEGCTEVVKSENPTNINNTGTMNMDHNMSGMQMNHADMVNSEFDFVYLMIPHHQEAVDTSKILLQTTKNPELIKLANNIIASQDKEINMMKGWINNIYSGNAYEGMGYMLMMRPTSGLENKAIDRQWAEDMIKHHQGAIDMANKLLQIMAKQDPLIRLTEEGNKHREELKKFANDIITAQTKEIQDMKNIIAQIDHDNNVNHH